MLTVDISAPEVEELQKLVQQGQEKGFLTYDEIVSGLDEIELTKEQIEDFYTFLIDHSIELVEGEQYKSPPHEQPALALFLGRLGHVVGPLATTPLANSRGERVGQILALGN